MKKSIIPAIMSMLRRWSKYTGTTVTYDNNRLSIKRVGLPSVEVWSERKWLLLVKRYVIIDGLGILQLTKAEYDEILHMFRK